MYEYENLKRPDDKYFNSFFPYFTKAWNNLENYGQDSKPLLSQ